MLGKVSMFVSRKKKSSSQNDMAPTIAIRLPATVLFTVIIPELSNFNITNTNPSVIQSPLQSKLATLPDGYVAHPEIGVAYKVHDKAVTWKAARARCISEGAHLADIDTFLKFEILMAQSTSVIWTGIHRIHNDTEWVSDTTGLAVTTLPWSPKEPSGAYDCVYAHTAAPRGLRNFECQNTYKYVCELPIPENYDAQGIVKMTGITGN